MFVYKVLIGCDGANSIIGKFLNLKPIKAFSLSGIRGFTNYTSGHTFPREFVRIRRKEGSLCGRIPINAKLVYWFTALQDSSSPGTIEKISHIDYIITHSLNLQYPKIHINKINFPTFLSFMFFISSHLQMQSLH